MNQPTLYLMLGYPGAGKSTTAKIIHDITGAVELSSDEVRQKLFAVPTFTEHEHRELYRYLDRELETLMKEGKDVVYDANLNRYRHRQEKYELAKRYNYQTKLIWINAPKELAKARRIENQNHNLVPGHEDPASMFERIVRLFEEPYPEEKFIEVDGTQITPENIKKLLE